MALNIEARFCARRTPQPIAWLSGNGPTNRATGICEIDGQSGPHIETPNVITRVQCMAEVFVKTFRWNYPCFAYLPSFEQPVRRCEDYNEH